MKKLLPFLVLLLLFGPTISSVNATQIVNDCYIQAREIITCADTPPPDATHICGYKCAVKNKDNFQLSTSAVYQQITRRSTVFWQTIPLPSNAVIEKVEVRQYTTTNTAPSNQYVQFRKGISSETCSIEYDYMNTSTLYNSKQINYFTVASYYAYVDLGSAAVAELQSHKTYFYLGERFLQEPNYSDETWNGTIVWSICSSANPPQLRITYHLKPSTGDDMDEPGLIKRFQWFPQFVFILLGLLFIYIVLKD